METTLFNSPINKARLCYLLFLLGISNLVSAQTQYSIDQNGIFSPTGGGGTTIVLSDDEISAPLPIGFTFMFYGEPYDSFYISSNGFITFSPNQYDGCCGGQFLPDTASPNNLIAFAWDDLNPGGGGTISYFLAGSAPERKLAVNFEQVVQYNGNPITVQLVLLEGSNQIEIHTTQMSSSGGYHTMGVENAAGNRATVVTGRNNQGWSATNEFLRFSPVPDVPDDASVKSIYISGTCPGEHELKAKIINLGTNNIESFTVNWEINQNIQSPILWTAATPSDVIEPGDSVEVDLGATILTSEPFVLIKAWTSNPNGLVDNHAFNDTLARKYDLMLSGTYTIGTINADFKSFHEAVGWLDINGVCGPVLFSVQDGIYTEQVVIPSIPGASAINTVTFQSQSQDSTKVTLRYASSSVDANYTMALYASFVSFHQIRIQATGDTFATAVYLGYGAKNNTFSHDIIEVTSNGTGPGDRSGIRGNNSGSDSTRIVGNRFLGGDVGIIVWEDIPVLSKGLRIEGNQFTGQVNQAIALFREEDLLITRNMIVSDFPNAMGIALANCGKVEVNANKINLRQSGRGISISHSNGNTDNHSMIWNNFVNVQGADYCHGIILTNSDYQDIYFNNISVVPTNPDYPGINFEVGEGMNIRLANNIFANTAPGILLVFQNGNTDAIVYSDYNDFFISSSTVWSDGTQAGDLATWRANFQHDQNSFTVDPKFEAPEDLHVSAWQLNGTGNAIIGINTDIDGELRNNPPDIGADEFVPSGADAGINAVIPHDYIGAGKQTPKAVLHNYGQTTLSTIAVNWKINNTLQAPVQWSGNLLPGQSDTLQLDSFNFVLGAVYQLAVWTMVPNDLNVQNDTFYIDSLRTALKGTYTIGAGNDFQTINEAVAQLNQTGVADSVVFLIAPGTYNEQISIRQFPNASCTRPVMFTSQTGDASSVIISFSATSISNNYIIYLDGADGIAFQNLTLEAKGAVYARIVEINNGASCNQFDGNIFKGSLSQAGTTLSYKALCYSPNATGSVDNQNVFTENEFIGGSYALHLGGYTPEFGTEILGNTFREQFFGAIYLAAQSSALIKGNIITGSNSTIGNYNAINLVFAYDSIRITNNRITIPQHAETGIHVNFDTDYPSNNIYGLIGNNFIVIYKGDHYNNGYCRGIDLENVAGYKLLYNTVRILSSDSGPSSALFLQKSKFIHLYNNIWSNEADGLVLYQDTTQTFTSNHNCLFTTGAQLSIAAGATFMDINSWRVGTGQDAGSVSVNPLFFDSVSYHVGAINLDGQGLPVEEITTDIDGEPRDSQYPDIGADEFTPSIVNDAGVVQILSPSLSFSSGSQPIKVAFRNLGINTLHEVALGFSVNGNQPVIVNWTGNLLKGAADTITLGNYTFQFGVQYQIVAWTLNPNGNPDERPENDTLTSQSLIASLGGIYTIGGINPDFANFTQAVTAIHFGGIHDNVEFHVRNGTYNEQIEVHEFIRKNNRGFILFKSENEDSTSVVLTYQSGNDVNNYTVLLNGVDSVSFQYMTIESRGEPFGKAIVLQEGASYNAFSHNIIKAFSGVSSAQSQVGGVEVKNHFSKRNHHNNFLDNQILGGYFGISYYQGGSEYLTSTPAVNISNNSFSAQSSRPLDVYASRSSVNITGNTVSFLQNQSGTYNGMTINAGAGTTVGKNRIQMSSFGTSNASLAGISITSPQYISGRIQVSNNFVSVLAGSNKADGVAINGNNFDILYNSILVSSNEGVAINFPGGEINVINNIFANIGGGATFHCTPLLNNIFLDHNDYYTNGNTLGVVITSPDWSYFSNLSDWRQYSQLDSNSLSVDPSFVAPPFDLHAQSNVLNDAALVLQAVPDDIDGQPRDPNLPDIGADEFPPTSLVDAGILAFNAPLAPFSAGSNPVSVTIRNAGSEILQAATIEWEVNGIKQPDVSWTGMLNTGDTITALLGDYVFLPKTAHTLRIKIVSLYDSNHQNDTLRIENVYPALEGIYTIGGSSPDFINFNSANKVLTFGGVLAPVEFLVRNGVYQEQFYLQKIIGASAHNSILYRSEMEDSTLVTLRFSATSADSNYTICLDGASWITFQGMTIQGSGANFVRVVDIRKGANLVTFQNNRIRGSYAANVSNALALVYKKDEAISGKSDLRLLNNQLEGGSMGLWYEGYSTMDSAFSHLKLQKNKFSGQYAGAIDLNSINFPIIENNEITNSGQANSDYKGISNVYFYDGSRISFNKVVLQNGQRGISQSYGVSNDPDWVILSQIDNNFVSMVASEGAIGLEAVGTPVYFNSVNLYGTIPAPSSRAFDFSGEGVYNNIFSNFAGGYAVYAEYSGNYFGSNFNCYYSNGQALGYLGHPIVDLASWRLSSGQDSTSIAEDPIFISNQDLHVIAPLLNEAGTPIPGITWDIDGEPRDILHPDIGADEFAPLLFTNAALTTISSPLSPFGVGPQAVSAVLRNLGSNTLNTVNILLSVDGTVVKNYFWTGQLATGQVDTVIIDTINFPLGTFHDLLLLVTNPNGVTDLYPANDTISIQGLHAFMAGVYMIGGGQPDFNQIKGAIDTLSLAGMMDTVTFKIRQGNYEEQLEFQAILGNECNQPVIFESESGDSTDVVISYDAISEEKNYVLQLDGVRGIIFRHLSFSSKSPNFGRILQITGRSPAFCHIFSNCVFQVYPNNLNSEAIAVSKSFPAHYPGSVFTQNRIEGGKYGIVYSGISADSLAGDLKIIGNKFSDQLKGAIDLKWVSYPQIEENNITSIQGDAEFRAIGIEYSLSFTISKNKLAVYHGGEGISIRYCNNSTGLGALFPPVISNNFVYVGGNATGNGISILNNSDFYRSKVQILNNNIHFTGKQGNALFISISGGFSIYDDDKVDIVNNNLVNSGAGYAFHYDPSFSSLGIMDYNNLYSTGDYLAALGASLKYATLPVWQNASNKDFHSLSVDPYYLKFDDLHTQQPHLNESGIKIAYSTSWPWQIAIWDDIDGDLRDALHPDIGADEFIWKEHDIRISTLQTPKPGCALGDAEIITIQVQNIGKQPEQNIQVGYALDAQPIVLESLSDVVLLPGKSISYSFQKKADMQAAGAHELIVFSKLVGDENLVNDTLSINLKGFPPMNLSVTPDTAICIGGDIQLIANVNGPATYKWNTGETTSGIVANPDSTSLFWVSATNIYGCTLKDTVLLVVNVPLVPIINYNQDTICGGTKTILSVDDSGMSLLWSNNEISPSIQVGTSGLYSVSRTDNHGCTATSSEISITALPQPTIQVVGFLPLCIGDSIDLIVSSAAEYQWSSGEQQASIRIAPQDTTTYTVITTNNFGCVDTIGITIPVVTAQAPPKALNLLPQDSSFNLSLPLIFSWQGTPLASAYDLYSWDVDESVPSTPTLSNLNQLNYALTNQTNPFPYFEYGNTYNWFIVAKNSCFTTPSDTQTFSLRHLPDLVIDTVIVPLETYSGHSINLSWITRNQGSGKTIASFSNGWYDDIYLTLDSTLDLFNSATFYALGSFQNSGSLEPGDAYARSAEVLIPEGLSGNMYLFVIADKSGNVGEADEDNNRTYTIIPITLTAPPDLQILSVIASSNAFSEQVVNLQWTVSNQGQSPTRKGSWSDKIWITSEPSFDPTLDYKPLAVFSYQDGILDAGKSYTASMGIVLPEGIWGTFYLYVITDYTNQVYENPFEQNNVGRSTPIEITLKPPPDLVVSTWSLPDTVSSYQEVVVQYTLKNQGGSLINKPWTDRIFWTTKAGQVPKRTVQILEIPHNQEFTPGSTLLQAFKWTIPDTLDGPYNLVIYPDYEDVIYEYTFEDNNRKEIPIEIITPDLIVSSITIPDTAWSGQSIPITYVVRNIGKGDLFPRLDSILDKIFIHVTPQLNISNAIQLKQIFQAPVRLHPGESITVTTHIKLPNSVSGAYYMSANCDVPYILSFTNAPPQVFEIHEEPSENNNVGSSQHPMWIWLSPWWDLAPIEFITPDTVDAGTIAPITIKVKNNGPGPVQAKEWMDKIFWGQANIASVPKNALIPVDSSYQATIPVTMPCPKKEGIWYLQLKVDANENIYEFTGESNNELLSSPIYFRYPKVDLVMSDFAMPDTVLSGRTAKTSLLVSNLGAPAAACKNFWYDDLYFSKDSILDAGDQHFRHLKVILDGANGREEKVEKDPLTGQKYTSIIYHISALNSGSTYRLFEDFEVPDGISGRYYFIARADVDSTHSDPNRNNNTFIWPVQITLSPPPDLKVAALTVPDNLYAGEKMTVQWTVINSGIGVTNPAKWWDAIYFSKDFTRSADDIFAGDLLHSGMLQPGQSYQKQAEIDVPANLSGNYLMLLATDSRDSVYEHLSEGNNTLAKAVVVKKVPPADLMVTTLLAPDTVLLGQYDSIRWEVKNVGINPAEWEFRDAVYFSEDAVLDPTDILFGFLENKDPIAPQQTVFKTLGGAFSGLKLGNYYVLVTTDIQDRIPETDELNNQLVSLSRTAVTVSELQLDIPAFNDMPSPDAVFYRLEIPDSLSGESLLLEFDGDSVSTFNELYLKYQDVPTRVTHDFSSKIPFATHQEIVVPALKTGTYYTMAYGNRATPDTQATRLLARILNFELRSYNPAKGANSGTVTIELKGSKFDANMLVRLQNGTDTITAQYLYYLSPTHAFARFDLNGVTPGWMDFWLENQAGDTFVLPQAFEVVTGTGGQLVYHAVYPEFTRANQLTPITIEYANGGLTDLIDPRAEIKAILGAPLALAPEQLSQDQKILILPLREFNGPPNVLRPGAIGSVTVYTRGPKILLFVLYQSP